MNALTIVSLVLGVVGVVFGLNAYYHLWRWARQCQHARIAIAFKRKVQLQAPLVEWLLWSRQLKAKENGRVVYRNGGVTVAIVKAAIPPGRIRRYRMKRKREQQPGQAESRMGSWSMKQERTPQDGD